MTTSGYTARMISKYRPPMPIIAATSSIKTSRELRLIWGVSPIIVNDNNGSSSFMAKVLQCTKASMEAGYLSENDRVIVTAGLGWSSDLETGNTNTISIFKVSDILAQK